jgi:hypothetical protein
MICGYLQLRPQLGMVLDDAVMDNGDAWSAVRMAIALGGRAVPGPAFQGRVLLKNSLIM